MTGLLMCAHALLATTWRIAAQGVLATRQGTGVFVTALDVTEDWNATLRRADILFHRSIIVAAHNQILTDLFDSFTPRSRQAMIDLLRMRGEFGSDTDHNAHSLVLDAIASQDPERAAALTRTHLHTLKMENQ